MLIHTNVDANRRRCRRAGNPTSQGGRRRSSHRVYILRTQEQPRSDPSLTCFARLSVIIKSDIRIGT